MRTRWMGLCLCSAMGCSGGNGGSNGVSGRLVGNFGAPAPFAEVMVVGEEPTATDENGRFRSSAGDVYDLVARDPATGEFSVVLGLTTRRPTLFVSYPSGEVTGSMTGSITGGAGFPAGGTVDHGIAFQALDSPAIGFGSGSVDSATGEFQGLFGWTEVSEMRGRLHVLQLDGGPLDATFTGYGTAEADFRYLETTSGATVALASLETGSVTATVSSLPPGYVVRTHRRSFLVGPAEDGTSSIIGSSVLSTATTLTATAPVHEDLWTSLRITARHPTELRTGAVQLICPAGTSVPDLTIPGPVSFISPVEDGTYFPSAPVSWTPFEHDGVYSVFVLGTDFGLVGSGVPVITVYTDEESFTMPDLTPLGYAWTAGTRFMSIGADDRFSSVDALAPFEDSKEFAIQTIHTAPRHSLTVQVAP